MTTSRGRALAAHKLFAPPAYSDAILRQEILGRIFQDDGARVIVLQAPAGHGKSTLMQQAKSMSEAHGALTRWLSLDEADNDITRFFQHLQALAETVESGARDAGLLSAHIDPRSDLTPRSDWFVNRLIRLDKPVAIFFDEFQTIHNRTVKAFFRNLLLSVPAELTVFIGSRTLPDLGLARLEVNHQALILRAGDLRFSRSEVQQFFAQASDLGITPEEAVAIHERSEGWPAALQLYRLSLANPMVRRSLEDIGSFRPRQLAEYLAENVLALQPPRVQKFLLHTSLLNRLSGPLCDAVMGTDDAQRMLEKLETSGLFLRSLDAEMRWFKYHTLFSNFLAEQLSEQASEVVPEIHRSAAHWCRDNDILDEAMHHAIAAKDYELAAEVFDIWASQLVMAGSLITVEHWYDVIPLDVVARRPDLVIKVAHALAFLRRRHKIGPILKLLKEQARSKDSALATKASVVRSIIAIIQDNILQSHRIVQEVEVDDPEAQGFRAFELGAAANLKGYLAMAQGDFESARGFQMLARGHGEREKAIFSWGYAISTAGVNLMMQGLLNEALDYFRMGMAEPRVLLGESVASASLVSCYVQALYEIGDLDAARKRFEEFHDVIADAAMLDFLAVAYTTMSRVHDAQGRPVKAIEVLDEAEAIGRASSWSRLIHDIGWERVRLCIVHGETDRARAIADHLPPREEALPEGWIPFSEDAEGDAVGSIRLAVAEGRAADALVTVERELTLAKRQGRVRRQVKLQTLEALAKRACDDEEGAHASLDAALRLAAPEPLLRSFLDEGRGLRELLCEHYQKRAGADSLASTEDAAALRLLRAVLEAGGVNVDDRSGAEFYALNPLTDREREILRLLATGVSNKRIAARIHVSGNTVKFHLKNIYSKLGVDNRIQAIQAARDLALIVD